MNKEKLTEIKNRIKKFYAENEKLINAIAGGVSIATIAVLYRHNKRMYKMIGRAHKELRLLYAMQDCVEDVVKTGIPHDWHDQFGEPLFQIVSLRKAA